MLFKEERRDRRAEDAENTSAPPKQVLEKMRIKCKSVIVNHLNIIIFQVTTKKC